MLQCSDRQGTDLTQSIAGVLPFSLQHKLQVLLTQDSDYVTSYNFLNLCFGMRMLQYAKTLVKSAMGQAALLPRMRFTWSSGLAPWGALVFLLALLEEGVAA